MGLHRGAIFLAMGLVAAAAHAGARGRPHESSRHHHRPGAPRTTVEPAAATPPAPTASPALRALTLQEVRAAEQPPQLVPPADIRELVTKLGKLADDDPARADTLYQLARLHAEQERYWRFQAGALAERVQALGASDEAAAARAELLEAGERRSEWLKSATQKYRDFITNPAFAQYRRMDQALVALITLYTLQQREEDARPLVKWLLAEYPDTLSMPDAYLAFAEYFFDLGDWAKAASFYERMLKYPSGTRFTYARYKAGWCQFALKDWQAAMADFVAVIKRGAASPAGDDIDDPARHSGALLVEASRRAAVWTYAQAGAGYKAWPFIRGIAGDAAPATMELLADDFARLGKHDQQSGTLLRLARENVDSPRRCEWQARALATAMGANPEAATEAPSLETLSAMRELVDVAHEAETGMKVDDAAVAACRERSRAALGPLVARLPALLRDADQVTITEAATVAQMYARHLAAADDRPRFDVVTARLSLLRKAACEALPLFVGAFHAAAADATGIRRDAARGAVESWGVCRAGAAPAAKKEELANQLVHDSVELFVAGGDAREARAFFESVNAASASSLESQYREALAAKGATKRGHGAHR